jgi:ribosomal protein L7/L12
LVIAVAVGLVMVLAGAWAQERRTTAAQIAATQRKLDLVLDHLGIADQAPEQVEVVRCLESGQLIEAVRIYRRLTGTSLLDAKQAVDRIAEERGLTGR